MTTTTVTGKLTNPAAVLPARGAVTFVLVDYSDSPVIGFDTTDQTEIVSAYTATPGADGTWTQTLTPNSLIEGATGPMPTAWRVIESGGGADGTYHIIVPATGGPYWVGTLRTALVGSSAPTSFANLAVAGTFTYDGVALASPPNDPAKFLAGNGQWLTGGGAVSSVNGHVGAVVLNTSDVGALAIAQNLADVASPTTARTNLGLGNSATRAVGTTAGTVAAGDDSRIVGALQSSTFSRDQHASKFGLLLEPFPVETINTIAPGLGLVSGNLYGQLCRPTAKAPVYSIGMWLCSAGSGPTGSSYVAVLDESGNELGVSADMTSYLTNVANEGKYIEVPLVTPTAALDFDTGYYACVLSNLSTIPRIAGVLPSAGTFAIPRIRGHLAAWFSGGLSSVPSHVDLSTVTTAVAGYWLTGLPA